MLKKHPWSGLTEGKGHALPALLCTAALCEGCVCGVVTLTVPGGGGGWVSSTQDVYCHGTDIFAGH